MSRSAGTADAPNGHRPLTILGRDAPHPCAHLPRSCAGVSRRVSCCAGAGLPDSACVATGSGRAVRRGGWTDRSGRSWRWWP